MNVKRTYHVVAISVRIVYNNFGEHDPNGHMYVLKENQEKVKFLVSQNPFTPIELIQPLVIRANVGDEVEIKFENQLDLNASMHFQEAEYDVMTSDGAFVGKNKDTTVPPGGEIVYRLQVVKEGTHFFSDLGNVQSSEDGTNVHGLFGALIVQRRGSRWTDPVTGGPINSGVFADIHHPLLPSFREYAWFFSDELEMKDLTGNKPLNPHTFRESSTFSINYRSEPMRNRVRLVQEGVVCPDCEGEEVHHDSWVFGDPATPILRGYRGDPAKIRLIHGGIKETHTFHYHVHQWFSDPGDINSNIIDVQAISPQNHYTVEPLYGLGSLQGAIGDVIVHCHLYPHFDEGMWGMNRIFDTLQDGTQCYPNGTSIQPLQPLPDRPLSPKPTKEKPGFPNFIPGKVGFKAPRPPLGIVNGRRMTKLEKNAAVKNARPGAVFTDPCLGNPVTKEFNISAIQLPIVYNKQGWNDPNGRIFILDKDIDAVLCGRKPIEPLVIHVEAGDCLRLNLTNRLPNVLPGSAFQLVNRTYECGMHVHFVKFDVLVSDGANIGWNYDSSVLPGETIRYEWYADVELKATFWHDHLFPNSHQQHGLFAGTVIHPRFSKFLDSSTGKRTDRGTQITVGNPLIPDFRDFTLFVQDFTLLFDKNGNPIEKPEFPGSDDDPGIFAVNYRNEPMQFRIGPGTETAYAFSSFVHGDPITPILRTYAGDPIRIRMLQGAQEESHSLNLHGLRWKSERRNQYSEYVAQQHIGISESFTLETFVPREGDYFYAYEDVEDVWTGLWGIIRAFGEEVDDLIPLKDRPRPPRRTTPLPKPNGQPPVKAIDSGKVCFPAAPVREYDVVALQTPTVYNSFGDHDPFGIVFALKEDVPKILTGEITPEPLDLRGNVGDCVKVTLTNLLNREWFHRSPNDIHGYPAVKIDAFFPPSLRISLHPQLLDFDVRTSSGDTVGFNPDQTVGPMPGDSITYHWYVDVPFGSANMWDVADLRNHRHHGAFGAFVAEPRGSRYLDPKMLDPLNPVKTGTNVVISNPFLPTIREFVLLLHDGVRLLNEQDKLIKDPTPLGIFPLDHPAEEVDTYDQGSRGFNYRSERLQNRLKVPEDLKDAFSHKLGIPATPLFEAYAGDPVTVRIVMPSERRRAHTFRIHGHRWRSDRDDIHSEIRSIKGQIVPGGKLDAVLISGAGGLFGFPGDYMYRSGNIRWHLENGIWGIMRVHPKGEVQPHLKKLEG